MTTSGTIQDLNASVQSVETLCGLLDEIPKDEDPRTRLLRLCNSTVKKKKNLGKAKEKLAGEIKSFCSRFKQGNCKFHYGMEMKWVSQFREWIRNPVTHPLPGPVQNMIAYTTWGRECEHNTTSEFLWFDIEQWYMIKTLFGCDVAIVREEASLLSMPRYEEDPFGKAGKAARCIRDTTLQEIKNATQELERLVTQVNEAKSSCSAKLQQDLDALTGSGGENENSHLCTICMEKGKVIAWKGCGHLMHCEECQNQYARTSEHPRRCPMCRQESECIKIFF